MTKFQNKTFKNKNITAVQYTMINFVHFYKQQRKLKKKN